MQGFWGRRVFFRIGFLVGDLIMKSSGCLRGCAELVKMYSEMDILSKRRSCIKFRKIIPASTFFFADKLRIKAFSCMEVFTKVPPYSFLVTL